MIVVTTIGVLMLVWLFGVLCGLGIAGSAYAIGRRSWRRGSGSIGTVSHTHLQTLRSDDARRVELGL